MRQRVRTTPARATFFVVVACTACDKKGGLVTEARLLSVTPKQMPLIRKLHTRLAERRSTWGTTTLTIMTLSRGAEQKCQGQTLGLVGWVLKEKGASS